MPKMRYRLAQLSDIDTMARIRTEGGWEEGASADRMALYLSGKHHPKHALAERSIHIAESDDCAVPHSSG